MAFNFKWTLHLTHFLYPPLCLHCQTLLLKRIPVLCPCCLEQISLASVEERCSTCFSLLQKGRCDLCMHRPVVIRKQIAASERIGPAATLSASLLQDNPLSAAPLAALMAYQWFEYKMPLPDLIIPLPLFFWQSFNPHFLLAREVGKIFSIPVLPLLKKKWDRECFLTEGEFHSRFSVNRKRSEQVCDRTVLLIAVTLDDRLLRKAAESLQPFFPKVVFALAGVS